MLVYVQNYIGTHLKCFSECLIISHYGEWFYRLLLIFRGEDHYGKEIKNFNYADLYIS